ncbi:MAG: hypothetical protein J3Q66DRAFT_329306 [Benniella sp.]|nr:MAG: hypothetical protein J3Q66DRAFT_332838 [Benniella sp.]KAK3826060.1 MAG: hypothetical protein J3Q66DRAFT_329306 [Benniella sp.]
MDRKVMNVTCNEGIKTRALLTLLSSLPSSTSLPCRHPHRHDRPGQGFPAKAGRSCLCFFCYLLSTPNLWYPFIPFNC